MQTERLVCLFLLLLSMLFLRDERGMSCEYNVVASVSRYTRTFTRFSHHMYIKCGLLHHGFHDMLFERACAGHNCFNMSTIPNLHIYSMQQMFALLCYVIHPDILVQIHKVGTGIARRPVFCSWRLWREYHQRNHSADWPRNSLYSAGLFGPEVPNPDAPCQVSAGRFGPEYPNSLPW